LSHTEKCGSDKYVRYLVHPAYLVYPHPAGIFIRGTLDIVQEYDTILKYDG